MDATAAVVGLAWDVVVLALLWRMRDRGALFVVLAFALVSLYPADRALPRVLVDAWPNFDATSSPALRPWFVLPDLVLIAAVLARVRWPVSRTALVMVGMLAISTAVGLIASAGSDAIPFSAALFWATLPVRGMLVLLLADATIQREGPDRTAAQVVSASILGAGVLAVQLVGVTALQALADFAGYDLAAIWSGFDWQRPNLPGWNNNLAATAIGLGAAAAWLMPERTWWPAWLRATVVLVAALALLAAEYRTAIIVFVAAAAVRTAVVVFRITQPRWDRLALAPAAAAGLLAGGILLGAAAIAVPRLADLNPVAYVSLALGGPEIVEPETDPGVPSDETDSSSQTRGQILRVALTVWQRQPITGPGLGAWEFERPTEPTILQTAITPHSGYAWALADLGLLGMVAIYALPAALILWRRAPATVFVWLVLLALTEIAAVGIAHARLGELYWAAVGVGALAAWPRASDSTPEPA